LEGAIAEFDRAIQRDRRYAAAFYDRGTVRTRLRDLDGAVADFRMTIEVAPPGSSYADLAKRALAQIERARER
jgi:tetratricopeptide (TPR) repeat protein